MVLVAACMGVFWFDGSPQAESDARSAQFQDLVGGLGFGPAADLSRCAFSFDPRLCDRCPEDVEPIPGGVYFCPQHGCSILYYPPLVSQP
jgi:hypothetical protein